MINKRFLKLCSVVLAALCIFAITEVRAANPWEEPSDPAIAINKPFEYAWKLFIALNWPAGPNCKSDPSKKLGDAGPTVWEKWRERSETYLPEAEAPPSWAQVCATSVAAAQPKQLTAVSQNSPVPILNNAPRPAFTDPESGVTTASTEEVRLNEATYEFIRTKQLYSRNEQLARAELAFAARKAGTPFPPDAVIDFPLASKEVKGHWAVIREEDKPRYHWAVGTLAGKPATYGLVALSITTKDLPNWVWTTFEHVDNEKEWPTHAKKWPDDVQKDPTLVKNLDNQVTNWFAGWIVKSVDKFACPQAPHDCNAFPKGLGLEGTKWQYYRLRGVQLEFVEERGDPASLGKPTALVNSKIEGNFEQNNMSCITCHALAAVGPEPLTGNSSMPMSILKKGGPTRADRIGYTGIADIPALYKTLNGRYMQLDFVWSLRNALCDPKDKRPCL